MAKPFRSLWEKMSPDAQAAAEQQMQAMLAAMPLQELQQARHRAHAHLTTIGQGTPVSLAKLERRTDLYISTLRSFIEALGGALEITATFPEGVVRITRFHDLAASETCEPGALPAEGHARMSPSAVRLSEALRAVVRVPAILLNLYK